MKLTNSTKILLILILIFYSWIAFLNTFSVLKKHHTYYYYNHLAKAFLNGQLHLKIKPPEELLKLPNQYDPDLNRKFRNSGSHDLSLYKGRFYLYFGAVPVLLLYIPFQLITKHDLPDGFANVIFCFGTLIWLILLLTHLKKKYFGGIPNWFISVSILICAFSNIGLFLIAHPLVYEVSSCCSCFLLTGAIYFLCLGVSELKNIKCFILGSIFCGLAVGTRAQNLLAAGLLLFFISIQYLNKKSGYKILFSLIFPFGVLVLILAIYNYLRFENIFEFGINYQLTYADVSKYKLANAFTLKPQKILSNTYSFLFQPPRVNLISPFIHLNAWKAFYILPEAPNALFPIVGLFTGNPFTILCLLFPFVYLNHKKNKHLQNAQFPINEFCIIILPGLINLLLHITFSLVIIRYSSSFTTNFILASCIIWFYLDNIISNQIKIYLRTIIIVLSIISIVFGASMSLEGCARKTNITLEKIYSKVKIN